MSDLINIWLNDEVQLSRKVTSFEVDFANGYLFGELLAKYNQQLDFGMFRNDKSRDSKISNFTLLRPTFRTLKVKFDSIIVKDIVSLKKGAAQNLLYQLKMVLDKVNIPSDALQSSVQRGGKNTTLTPLLTINPPIEQYASMDSKFFKDRICELNRSQKSINLDVHLDKFKAFKETHDKAIKRAEKIDEEKEKQLKEQLRKIELGRMQRSIDFQVDWNQQGMLQWRKNMEVTRSRVEYNKRYETQTLQKQESKRLQIRALTKSETFKDIASFEETLKKLGMAHSDNEEDDAPVSPIKVEHKHAVNAAATMQRIKEKSKVNEFLRNERDKRRRKMIVDQAKFQRDIELRSREESIIQKISQQSRQEKEIEYEIWRALQYKDVIIENRNFRNNNYTRKHNIMILNSKNKEEEQLRLLSDEFKMDLAVKAKRQHEIEISRSQVNHRDAYDECGMMIDQIVNLFEICYVRQQQTDNEQIEDHFFSDEIKLFIEQSPLIAPKQWNNTKSASKVASEEVEAEKEEEIKSSEYLQQLANQQTQTKTQVALAELQDYLQDQGCWKLQIEPTDSKNTPPSAINPPTINSAKQPQQTTTPVTAVAVNEPNAIPGTPPHEVFYIPNNDIFGDMVVELLRQHYVSVIAEAKRVFINELDWLPMKASILGYQFSGKKSLAKCLATKYSFALLSIDELIEQILKQYHEFLSDKNKDSIIDDQVPIVNSLLDENAVKLAQQIETHLYTGVDIPDEFYVELIMRQIRQLRSPLTQQQFLDEFDQRPEPQAPASSEVAKVKALAKELQLQITNEEKLEQSLLERKHKYTAGFILLDFPQTYEQASLLEKQLSGFIPKDEQFVNEYDRCVAEAAVLVKPTKVKFIPRALLKPGLDLVLRVDISKKESLRRALGRRYDPLTKEHYHLDDNPPPVDSAPLISRLEQIREAGTSELAVVDKNSELDRNIPQLRDWYSLFGLEYTVVKEGEGDQNNNNGEARVESENMNTNDVKQNGETKQTNGIEPGVDTKSAEAPKEIHKGLENEKDSQQQQNKQSLTPPASAKQQENSPLNAPQEKPAEKSQQDDQNKKEEERPKSQNNGQNQEEPHHHGDAPVVEEKPIEKPQQVEILKQIAWQEVDGSKKIDEIFYEIDAVADKIISIKEQKYEAMRRKLDAKEEQKRIEEEIERIRLENESKWLWTAQEELLQELAVATAALLINPDALANMVSLWKNILQEYVEGAQKVFFDLNEQQQVVDLYLYQNQKLILKLIQHPDEKFVHILEYQQVYNKFVLENPDMCEEDETKEELHQRVDDLHDVLVDIIDAKKEQASQERNNIMTSGWIEAEMERTMVLAQKLLQLEISRFFKCSSLIQDFFILVQGHELQDIPEYYKSDITSNPESLGLVEDGETFPRLEKLIELSLKLFSGEEESDEKGNAKKGGKGPAKKEDKKQPKKASKNAEEAVVSIDEKKEQSDVEKRAIEAINLEKKIVQHRIEAIRVYFTRVLKQLRVQSQRVYDKLDDWIRYSAQEQNKAVDHLDFILRHYVEQEKRIQQEIQFDYVDIIISHETLNFLTPPPIILKAKEPVYVDKFMISMLYIIVEELRSLSNENNLIESRSLLQLLTRKTVNPLSCCDLPESWRKNTIQQYQQLILNLDPSQTGYINNKDVCTYICLSGSALPSKVEEEDYYSQLKSFNKDWLTKQQFTSIPAWFDQHESTQIEINTNTFERQKYLKELLFYIHKDAESDLIEINLFMQSIQSTPYLEIKPPNTILTFSDLLFSQ